MTKVNQDAVNQTQPCIFIMVMVSSHYLERSELEPTLRPRVCGVDKALRFLFVAEPKTERYPRP